jgi:hypothetical protein
MEEGYVVDRGYRRNDVASWVAGKPEYGWSGSLKVWDGQIRPIQTFRCTKCGYLESYVSRK